MEFLLDLRNAHLVECLMAIGIRWCVSFVGLKLDRLWILFRLFLDGLGRFWLR
jgi:hypothetical protein